MKSQTIAFTKPKTAEDFKEKVMQITKGKGVNACVEVTGILSASLDTP